MPSPFEIEAGQAFDKHGRKILRADAQDAAPQTSDVHAAGVLRDAEGRERIVLEGGGSAAIQDEGVALTSRQVLDFRGDGVTATDNASLAKTVITIPGGNKPPSSYFYTDNVTHTDAPAGVSEISVNGDLRRMIDLTYATEARLCFGASAAGAATYEVAVQYSTDNGTTWAYLDGASGPSAPSATANVVVVSPWVNLAAGAKADVLTRIVGRGGDGLLDPAFRWVELQVR